MAADLLFCYLYVHLALFCLPVAKCEALRPDALQKY